MRIYIAGPITGNPYRRLDFDAAENMLRRLGYKTINPEQLCRVADGLTWRQYMRICKKLLRMADAIYLLEGFERSRGALIEFRRAHVYPNIKKIYLEAEGYPPEVTT